MNRCSTRRRERGMTLVEVVIAVAIFIVIFVSALMIYDRSNQTFKHGVEASETQQNTRVAFEKMVADVRMAGYDHDRDGIPFSSASGVQVWQPSRAYAVGSVVTPTATNGFTYIVTDDGTSDTDEPSWSTSVGAITNDGTVKWSTQTGVNQFQQPDEQIEFAGAHAVTLRANFDYNANRDADNGREGAEANTHYGKPILESPQFPVITTGNDEIVTYALHSEASGTVNQDEIQFYADVPDRRSFPGGRAENLVTIDDIDLCLSGCTKPPYTLYRITLSSAGLPIRTPLATNIRDVTFQYYANGVGTGTPLTFDNTLAAANSSGGGQYNPLTPGASATQRNNRSKIQSVRVILTGMNSSRAESGYVNPSEAAGSPARNYRTYELQSLVVPRNLGKMGQREIQTAPPGPPKIQTVCVGYCGAAFVEWIAPPPNPDEGTVEQYVIIYDTNTPPVRWQSYVTAGTSGFVYELDPGQTYYFTVAAVNSYGTRAGTDILQATAPARNTTTSAAPSGLSITGSGITGDPAAETNQVTLSWTAPLTTVAPSNLASCRSFGGGVSTRVAVVPPGEVNSYEIWRHSTDANFIPPGAGTLIPSNSINVLTVNQSSVTFIDKSAVPCQQYYYRIRGVETVCTPPTDGTKNVAPASSYTAFFPITTSPAYPGKAVASAAPAAPAALLPPLPTPLSNCGATCTIYLAWPKVKTDNVAAPDTKSMVVQDYIITRERWVDDPIAGTKVLDTAPGATVDIPVTDTTPTVGSEFTHGVLNEPYYTDTGYPDANLPSVDPLDGDRQYQYRYRVRAKLDCPSPGTWISDYSPEYRFPCAFTGTVNSPSMSGIITGTGTTLANAWVGDDDATSILTVTGTGLVSVQVLLQTFSGGTITNLGTVTGGPYDFTMTGLEPGDFYRIYIVSKDADGCLDIIVRYYQAGTVSGCCLTPREEDPFVVQHTPGTNIVDIFLKNECGNDLTIQPNGFNIVWDRANIPVGTNLQRLIVPTTAGGTTFDNVNNSTGSFTRSVPAGGLATIASETGTYRVRLQFTDTLPPAVTAPILNFCVSYQRAGIDLTTQNCRIVPEPVTQNSCN